MQSKKITWARGDVCHVRLDYGVEIDPETLRETAKLIEARIRLATGFYVPVIITSYGVDLKRVSRRLLPEELKKIIDGIRSDDSDGHENGVPAHD